MDSSSGSNSSSDYCSYIFTRGINKGKSCGKIKCKKHIIPSSSSSSNTPSNNSDKDIKTFIQLYEFLQNYENNSIIEWLNIPWKGKDKQESLFRLFSKLGLISKLECYKICTGNFNLGTFTPIIDKRDIFYKKNNRGEPIYLNDKGDCVDLVIQDEKDEKNIHCFSSKNLKKENIGKLDIEKIFTFSEDYKKNGYNINYGIVTKNTIETKNIIEKSEKSNKKIKDIIQNQNTIFIDWNDLDESFKNFKNLYSSTSINELFKTEKKPLLLKLHQKYSVLKTSNLIKQNIHNILWGHICRSGKSYIIAGTIIDDSINKNKCNYLLLTTAPNETIEQYIKVMYCEQLQDFNIICINGNNIKPKLSEKNIIIVSKQFLQVLENTKEQKNKKIQKLQWLSNLKIDLRFIDESHNGGTTEIVKNTLNLYGKNTTTIHISATYSKTATNYNILKEHWILWDLEDINLCKKYNTNRLIEKYGDEMKQTLEFFNEKSIIEEYSKFPEMWVITDELDDNLTKELIENFKNSDDGWSTDACFLLKQNENYFQNPEENLKLWYRIFGKKIQKRGYQIDDPNYPKDKVIINRIQNICSINESRSFSREKPLVIMAFLPTGQNPIDKVQNTTKKLLEDNKIIPDFDIICINSKESNNPKKTIEDGLITVKNNNKKGLLVLSGRQCSLGVTIEHCDIVLLLNDSKSFDLIFQMMFRSMSESTNKKYGFIVDLNIHRFINTTLLNFISTINPTKHPKKVLEYILKEKIITINNDQWITKEKQYINKMVDNIYKIYSSNVEKTLSHFLGRLEHKQVLLSKDDGILFKNIFMDNSKFTKKQNQQLEELTEKLFNYNRENINKGISKVCLGDDEKEENTITTEKEEQKKNLMEFLKHIIPLICILTIHDDKSSSFEEMSNYILSNQEILDVFQQQTMTWWGQNTDTNILQVFCKLFVKYLQEDTEVLQIIRTIKELFCKNVDNSKELSKLIDKYLIPHELEKKQNAEVSTPFQLRQEMLDTITKYGDCNFWKTPKKVFEPCAGKGGFLLDVIDRFMVGLEDEEKDSEKRYKLIVEECLYWSELNPVNVFICKLLLDPYGKYRLNYHEGNTLELNIGKKWEGRVGKGFDLVVGNPPYQQKQDNKGKKGGGDLLWNKFVTISLDQWVKSKGFLVYVHPSGWRKPESSKSKYTGMFKRMTTENQLLYLEIHDTKDGTKTFQCGTRYDWYILKKTLCSEKTTIRCQEGKHYRLDMRNWNFLPNSRFDSVYKLLKTDKEEEKCPIIQSMSYYETRKKWMSSKETEEYKYPCIHSTPKNGVRYYYSSRNDNGHFGVPKVIFGETGIYNAIVDMEAKYGMTQNSMGIPIDNEQTGKQMKMVLQSKEFRGVLESCSWSNFRIDWRMFTYFKKDFWREFITEE